MLPIWLNAWPMSPNSAGRQAVENWRITPAVQPLKDEVVGGVGDMLWILMATIGIVLLIACANVANLMLVRSESRRQEFAVRTALGAGRGQIAREVSGREPGALAHRRRAGRGARVRRPARWSSRRRRPRCRASRTSRSIRACWRLPSSVSLLSSLLFGALPALKHAAQQGPPLGGAARGASASRERQRTRNSLVVVQVALALVLLVGSGLMIRTFQALLNVEPGFMTAADLQTARVWVPPQQVPDPERTTRMQHEILDKIAALPGVTAAAFASAVPMEGPIRVWTQPIYVDGQRYAPGTTPPMRRMKIVSPGYFSAIGTRHDRRPRHHVERHLRARQGRRSSPRTSRVKSGDRPRRRWASAFASPRPAAPPVWREIVGIVEDVHEDALHQAAPAMVYWPVMMENFGGAPLFVMRAGQSGHPQRAGRPREPARRRPKRRVVGQLEHAGVPGPDDEGSLRRVDGADVVRAGDAGHRRPRWRWRSASSASTA